MRPLSGGTPLTVARAIHVKTNFEQHNAIKYKPTWKPKPVSKTPALKVRVQWGGVRGGAGGSGSRWHLGGV